RYHFNHARVSLAGYCGLASPRHSTIFEPPKNSFASIIMNALARTHFSDCLCPVLLTLFLLTTSVMVAGESDDLAPIFNGKDLAGWQVPDPNPFWRVADGVLIGENDPAKKGHVLYTKKTYKDFIIETEARWTGEIDSGIMLRQPELQMQIGISRSL